MIELMVNVTFIALITCITIITVTLIWAKYGMHKKSKELKNAGVYPSGAGNCHGLVMSSKDGSREVILDSQPSLTWFKGLLP